MQRRVVLLLLAMLASCAQGSSTVSERGIGGTGGPASGTALADRGIGGTGIVGVITGFGSVIVNGLEVAYDPAAPIEVDGMSAPGSELRAGQLAVISATGDAGGLHATSIAVRHEVSGPIEAVSDGGKVLQVAGQRVDVDTTAAGETAPQLGEWVAVSGLRQPNGDIDATRLDRRAPGSIIVRGSFVHGPGGWRIGGLPVVPPADTAPVSGQDVTVSGTYAGRSLAARVVAPDLLATNPAAYFGSAVRRFVLETYASVAGGQVRFGRGLEAAAAPGLAGSMEPRRTILEFDRGPGGRLVATQLRSPGGLVPRGGGLPADRLRAPMRGFSPAPVPTPRALGPGVRNPLQRLDRGAAGSNAGRGCGFGMRCGPGGPPPGFGPGGSGPPGFGPMPGR